MRLLGLLVALAALLGLTVPPASAKDPDWVFYTSDKHHYTSPWYAGAHRIMVPFGCTEAPYYDHDPRCPGDEGFHHGLDIAIPCGPSCTPASGPRSSTTPPSGRRTATTRCCCATASSAGTWSSATPARCYVEPGDKVHRGRGVRARVRQRRAGRLPPALRAAGRRGRPRHRRLAAAAARPEGEADDRPTKRGAGAQLPRRRRPAAHHPEQAHQAAGGARPAGAGVRARPDLPRVGGQRRCCSGSTPTTRRCAATWSRTSSTDPRGRLATGAAAGPSRSDEPIDRDPRRGLVRRGARRRAPRGRPVRRRRPDRGATSGATFEDCTFDRCRFNASVHKATAFVGCTFSGTNFFDATLDGCKLTGSTFTRCTLRPITVRGGQWRGVVLRGADLTGQDLSGVDLREADLSMAVLVGATLAGREPRRRGAPGDQSHRRRPARRRPGRRRPRRRHAQGREARPGRRRAAGRADRRCRGRRRRLTHPVGILTRMTRRSSTSSPTPILDGKPATEDDALAVLRAHDDELLDVVAAAGRLRREHFGNDGQGQLPGQPQVRPLPRELQLLLAGARLDRRHPQVQVARAPTRRSSRPPPGSRAAPPGSAWSPAAAARPTRTSSGSPTWSAPSRPSTPRSRSAPAWGCSRTARPSGCARPASTPTTTTSTPPSPTTTRSCRPTPTPTGSTPSRRSRPPGSRRAAA